MSKFKLAIPVLLLGLTSNAMASQPVDTLAAQRQQVISQYVRDLQAADVQDITSLFTDDAMAVSTSRGKNNAKAFFSSFLPMIYTAKTELHQSFMSLNDVNRYAIRFHLSFQLKDGEQADGEYMDEFIFANHSAKLVQVSMFENLHFD